jgi:hypothetical protein
MDWGEFGLGEIECGYVSSRIPGKSYTAEGASYVGVIGGPSSALDIGSKRAVK